MSGERVVLMRVRLLALCLTLVGCGAESTATLPADMEARVAGEGVVRRATDVAFRSRSHPPNESGRFVTSWNSSASRLELPVLSLEETESGTIRRPERK